jgi:hypothetical protein
MAQNDLRASNGSRQTQNNSRRKWIKAVVLTVGVADCAGIYLMNQKLNEPVSDEVRFDTAYTMPLDTGTFRPDGNGAPALAMAPVQAVPQNAAKPAAPSAAAPAARPAATTLPAPRLAAAALPSAPIKAPSLRLADLRMPAAGVPSGTVTVKSARTAQGDKVRLAAPQKSGLADGAPARKARHTGPSSLQNLVPSAPADTVFSAAFAGLDNPVRSADTLDVKGGPVDPSLAEAPTITDFAQSTTAASPAGSAEELPAIAPAADQPATL